MHHRCGTQEHPLLFRLPVIPLGNLATRSSSSSSPARAQFCCHLGGLCLQPHGDQSWPRPYIFPNVLTSFIMVKLKSRANHQRNLDFYKALPVRSLAKINVIPWESMKLKTSAPVQVVQRDAGRTQLCSNRMKTHCFD